MNRLGAVIAAVGGIVLNSAIGAVDWAAVNAAARRQALLPVRAGEPGRVPFWNANARAFIHPPAFDFRAVEGATSYRFVLKPENGKASVWSASAPWKPLDAEVWGALPPGYQTLRVEGLDDGKRVLGVAGERTFYRAAVFRGPYPAPARGYRETARRVYAAVFRLPHVQAWLTRDEPDESYDLYCYPAKILSSMIVALARHADDAPADRAAALSVARKMADWLIARSQPADAPLAHFPPTYWGSRRKEAVRYAGQNMLSYPAVAANAFFALAEATGEARYREQALRIARTYLKLQGKDGTWPLKVREEDGQPVRDNRVVPDHELFGMLDQAFAATGDAAFTVAAERAFASVTKGACVTWNWDGQYEDQDPKPPYGNLQKGVAADAAIRLFASGRDIALAREIVDWCEDQFVVWSDPVHHMDWQHWKTPTALEQYEYYTPIDASMADMIGAFAAAYRATGDALYLAKARALADNLTRNQRPDGTIPTYFDSRAGSDWVNCMVYSAERLRELADADEGALYSFSVRPQEVYTFEGLVANAAADGALELRFVDAAGKDVAETERQLGYSPSIGRASFRAGSGRVAMTCRAGFADGISPVRGIVTCVRGGPVRFASARAYPGEPSNAGAASAGIDGRLRGEGAFARNLASNGSFEELDGSGVPKHWKWTGPGTYRLSSDSYAGERSLELSSESAGGRLECDPVRLRSRDPVQILYAAKFGKYATPHGHLDPVRVEFLSDDGHGGYSPIRERNPVPRQEYQFRAFDRFNGEWFPAFAREYAVPQEAVALRVYCEYRDRRVDGRGGSANWGTMRLDNVAVWQKPAAKVPDDVQSVAYAPLFFGGVKPPQLPAGRRREHSVVLSQRRGKDGSFFFSEERTPVRIPLSVGDLIGYDRDLELVGSVRDENERELSSFSRKVSVAPYELVQVDLPVGTPDRYGAYLVQLAVREGGAEVARGTARFAFAERRSTAKEADKDGGDYPFDLHLGAHFNFDGVQSPETADLQAGLCEMLGVRGVRLQLRYNGCRLEGTEDEAASAARGKVADFRRERLPALRRHGIRWWVSLMEQDPSSLPHSPKTEGEFAAWTAWHRALAQELRGEADFVLFGNEGLGGYVNSLGPDANLWPKSQFDGSIRHWWRCCGAALKGLKAGDPKLLCGPAHASDPDGYMARWFRKITKDELSFDCWGVNSYVEPSKIACAVARELGERHVGRSFGVIPEIGHRAANQRDYVAAADKVAETYLSVLADCPWMRHITWFILCEFDGYCLFDQSYGAMPAAVAYLTMTETLGAGRVERHHRLVDGGRLFEWRRRDGSVVLAGWSPRSQPIRVETSGDRVECLDVYGNRSAVPVREGEALVMLGPRITYLRGGTDLRMAEGVRMAARIAPEGKVVQLAVKNLRRKACSFVIRAETHPFVTVDETSLTPAELAGGQKKILDIPVTAFRPNDARRLSVRFVVREPGGVEQMCEVDVTGLADRTLPPNLAHNGAFGRWKDESSPEGWVTGSRKGTGGWMPPEWRFCRCDGDGFLSAPCAAIVVPGAHPWRNGVLYYQSAVALKPNTRYFLGAALRTVARGSWPFPIAHVKGLAGASGRKDVPLKTVPLAADSPAAKLGWNRWECVFETGSDEPCSVDVELRMQNLGYGEVRYDDIELYELGPARRIP